MIEETRITQPETSADLSEKAMSINASIARLQEILKRYGPTGASDNFSGKARDQLKRAVYHFARMPCEIWQQIWIACRML